MSPTLLGQRYAFRDVNHFYLPLYGYVGQRTAEQWLPLWNPLDHSGLPLVGESSTAVLYPVRYVLFSLPLATTTAMNAYLLLHVLLAGATAWWAAAKIGCRPSGAAAAGIVYALSGSVFSLCCNPPFLVGAAWLPLAVGAAVIRDSGSIRWRVRCVAVALAMMVLGGDPQSALHCVLVIGCWSVARWLFGRRRRWGDAAAWEPLRVGVVGAALAVGLAAIQIAASVDWSLQSDRTDAAGVSINQYGFSLAPWHLVETISSRPFGEPFPLNRRLSKLIPGDGRMWTPSIYASFAVGLAVVLQLLLRSDRRSRPWLMVAILSALLCLGHFGIVWLLQQIPGILPRANSAVGGPYWLLCKIVPGYDSFRYPIKWLPMFAFGCAMVTGRWLGSRPRDADIVVLITLSLVALASVVVTPGCFDGAAAAAEHLSDEYWGPLDVAGGVRLAQVSWTRCFVLALAVAGMRWWQWAAARAARRPARKSAEWAAMGLVALIAVDAGTSAWSLLPRIDVDAEHRLVREAAQPIPAAYRFLRTQSGVWPDHWRTNGSIHRPLEVAVSERMALFGRWHLADGHAVFNSMTSIRSRAMARFWREIRSVTRDQSPKQRTQFWNTARTWLGADGVVHTEGKAAVELEGRTLVRVTTASSADGRPFRVHRRWGAARSLKSILDEMSRTGRVPIPSVGGLSGTPDVSERALAQDDELNPRAKVPADLTIEDDHTVRIRCDQPCLLERLQYQDGNWKALLVSDRGGPAENVPVLRCDVMHQAVLVPAGVWRVSFHYSPWWRWPAIALTVLSILVLVVPAGLFRRFPLGRRRANRSKGSAVT
ncbi:hypothetical protein FYK55_22990 [Roseiconus nitratireducens]|uniref:Membrane protein YfhO n=1 Tax=Roseiconus nitratireducens TaxID=2605748 RepID=A0A5M6CZR3_9BACT|nr:hypothetical protein [Roseiconus nitratireducens]KAA5539910.1 hypothetical protein FYK55_22990 [Roseiconus nitratireducens]